MIENLRLTLPGRGDAHTALFFNATVEKLGTDQGRAFATPFAVHKGQALLMICEFQRKRSGFDFEVGNYDIDIEALVGTATEWKVIRKFQLNIRKSQIEVLNSILTVHDNEPQLSQP